MIEVTTWRHLLAYILRDPEEKQRIALAVNVSLRQLERWEKNEATPHRGKIKLLIFAIPNPYQKQFMDLMREDLPDVVSTISLQDFEEKIQENVFWAIIETYQVISPLLLDTLQDHVLLSMLEHIDRQRNGLALLVALAQKDTSGMHLKFDPNATRGSGIWRDHRIAAYHSCTTTSLMRCVQTTKPNYSLSREDFSFLYEHHQIKSAAVLPLLRTGLVAGCLLLVSTQPLFFDTRIQDLITRYTWLLSLAYTKFYPPEQVRFRQVPEDILDQAIATFSHLSREEILEIVAQRLRK